jgi:hypothetical protein
MTGRGGYGAAGAGLNRGWAGGAGWNRAAFDARRRSFHDWYVSIYPSWTGYGYPFLFDDGFYDWRDFDDSGDSGYGPGYAYEDPNGVPPAYSPAYPGDGAPYPEEDFGQPQEPPLSAQAALPTPEPGEPLTLIFKDGRAPVKVQNYMMTATVLTDLDAQHYQRFPLDEIDLAATQQANSATGVEFEVPGVARE